jgi:hypothetical protein
MSIEEAIPILSSLCLKKIISNWLAPNVTIRGVPANWKWSSTIRRIDDDCPSMNFYLNLDLLYEFEKHFDNLSTELPV